MGNSFTENTILSALVREELAQGGQGWWTGLLYILFVKVGSNLDQARQAMLHKYGRMSLEVWMHVIHEYLSYYHIPFDKLTFNIASDAISNSCEAPTNLSFTNCKASENSFSDEQAFTFFQMHLQDISEKCSAWTQAYPYKTLLPLMFKNRVYDDLLFARTQTQIIISRWALNNICAIDLNLNIIGFYRKIIHALSIPGWKNEQYVKLWDTAQTENANKHIKEITDSISTMPLWSSHPFSLTNSSPDIKTNNRIETPDQPFAQAIANRQSENDEEDVLDLFVTYRLELSSLIADKFIEFYASQIESNNNLSKPCSSDNIIASLQKHLDRADQMYAHFLVANDLPLLLTQDPFIIHDNTKIQIVNYLSRRTETK